MSPKPTHVPPAGSWPLSANPLALGLGRLAAAMAVPAQLGHLTRAAPLFPLSVLYLLLLLTQAAIAASPNKGGGTAALQPRVTRARPCIVRSTAGSRLGNKVFSMLTAMHTAAVLATDTKVMCENVGGLLKKGWGPLIIPPPAPDHEAWGGVSDGDVKLPPCRGQLHVDVSIG